MTTLARILVGLLTLVVTAVGAILLLDRAPPLTPSASTPASAEQIARGATLARAGNCLACHTARGGAHYAGGRAIGTPFGTVYSSNLTPDPATGLGRWSADDFWRALHLGRGVDGRRLVPAFPYTEFTKITRADSDALFAWLRTLPPVTLSNRPQELAGLYGSPLALAAWRVLYFRPGEWRDDPARGAEWNRGAYLVNGPGHCVACHGGRNALGGQSGGGFGGGLIPTRNWYAPSLERADEAGVADWPIDEIVALLRNGVAPRGRASGPMAEVVQHGLQHLPPSDLRAMAVYLQSLPQRVPARSPAVPDAPRVMAGARLYADHCEGCHGAQGEGGVTPSGASAVPALAGNRLVKMELPINLVRSIALGGFGTDTAGHPRPFGMPPFAHALSDEQIAEIATFMRASWGPPASAVTAFDVASWRGGIDD